MTNTNDRSNPPHDSEAEEAILGDVTRNAAKVADVAGDLEPEHFYVPRHQKLWDAWLDIWDESADQPNVISWARRAGVEVEDVMRIVTNTFGFNRGTVETVIKHYAARQIMAVCFDARTRAGMREDPYEIAGELDHFVSTLGQGTGANEPEAITLWEMSETAEADSPWVVPGALRRDWRVVVTGEEGTGKGVLIRCMALSAAAGIHPFTHKPMEPQRTLMVDLENPTMAILETGLVLVESLVKDVPRRHLGEAYDETTCKFWHKPGGINIRTRQDRADLTREIAAHQPDLVCIGPWYKLQRPARGESHEDAAMSALAILDDLRTKYGFALAIEAHSPKGDGRFRDLRPMGSVYLSAWPDLGIGLVKDEEVPSILNVNNWRGGRLQNQWPQRITRSRSHVIDGQWDAWVGRIEF